MEMKHCILCNQDLPTEAFDRSRQKCKKCRNKEMAIKYKERRNSHSRAYHEANAVEIRARKKEHDRLFNGPNYDAHVRAYKAEQIMLLGSGNNVKNKEWRNIYARRWAQENKKRLNAERKERRKENKEAVNAYKREYRLSNIERERALSRGRNREYVKRPEGRTTRLLKGAANRASKRGEPFNVSRSLVFDALVIGICPKTGHPFNFEADHGLFRSPWAPSLDRIDSRGHYVDSNVQVTSVAYNVSKAEMTEAEHLEFCLAVVRTAGYECHLKTEANHAPT